MSQATVVYTTNDMDNFSNLVTDITCTMMGLLGDPECMAAGNAATPVNLLPDVLDSAAHLIKTAVEENTDDAWGALRDWFSEQFAAEATELLSISHELQKMMGISEEHADVVMMTVAEICDEVIDRESEDE